MNSFRFGFLYPSYFCIHYVPMLVNSFLLIYRTPSIALKAITGYCCICSHINFTQLETCWSKISVVPLYDKQMPLGVCKNTWAFNFIVMYPGTSLMSLRSFDIGSPTSNISPTNPRPQVYTKTAWAIALNSVRFTMTNLYDSGNKEASGGWVLTAFVSWSFIV